MHTLEETAETLGIGYGALRDRLRALDGQFDPYLSRGKKGKILVDGNGLHVLRRVLELERSGMSIADSAQSVRKELALDQNISDSNGNSSSTSYLQATDKDGAVWELVEQLKQENSFLKQQIAMKDDQMVKLQDFMQNQLPGKVTHPGVSDRDTIHYLNQLIERQDKEMQALRQSLDEMKKPWWQKVLPGKAPQQAKA